MKKNKILWAPWRYEYIAKEHDNKCFLCGSLKDCADCDKSNLLLYRGEKAFIILNIYPYNNGHLLIAPKRHINTVEFLKNEEEKELAYLIKNSVRILKNKMKAQGFNIGLNLGSAAGAGLDSHMHYHIVPRWKGDTNFMKATSDSKVISQSLQQLYELLHPEFEKIKKCT